MPIQYQLVTASSLKHKYGRRFKRLWVLVNKIGTIPVRKIPILTVLYYLMGLYTYIHTHTVIKYNLPVWLSECSFIV